MSEAIVVTEGERTNVVGSEIFIAIHCQECGERITDSDMANVAIPRGVQPGEKQSFKIVCLDCDLHRDKKTPTSWIKLHEFIETLADSVGMKRRKKIQEINGDCLSRCFLKESLLQNRSLVFMEVFSPVQR